MTPTALLWPAGMFALIGAVFAANPPDAADAGPARSLGPDLLQVGVGALLVMIGNSLLKSRPSRFVGIRTPRTLADTNNWIATHRLGGKVMMGSGCLIVAAGLSSLPRSWRGAVFMALLGIAVVAPVF